LGALYMLKLKKMAKADAAGIDEIPRLRTSAEISAAALDAYWEKLTASGPVPVDTLPSQLPPSRLLQNWRWYVTEHWKQALVTSLCYLLTFLLWRQLA
jgi:hypothetical protein